MALSQTFASLTARLESIRGRRGDISRRIADLRTEISAREGGIETALGRGDTTDNILKLQEGVSRLRGAELQHLEAQLEALAALEGRAERDVEGARGEKAHKAATSRLAAWEASIGRLQDSVALLADAFDAAESAGDAAWAAIREASPAALSAFRAETRLGRAALEDAFRVALRQRGFAWAAPNAEARHLEGPSPLLGLPGLVRRQIRLDAAGLDAAGLDAAGLDAAGGRAAV